MKKFICAILAAAAIFGFSALAEDNISVMLDNEVVEFDQPPTIINARTLVPVRAVFEKAGAQVDWDASSHVATITRGNYTIRISPNNDVMYKNGKAVALDVPAQIINDRILIPVRAIAEAMDFEVSWNGYLNTVLIATDGVAYRAYAGVKRGFRDIADISDLYMNSQGKGYSDLDGNGELDTIEFTPMIENEGQSGVLMVNGLDYSALVSDMASVTAVAAVNINNESNARQLVVIEGQDVNIAHFFTFNGTDLKECSYTKPVRFMSKLLFDEKRYILSDLHGFLFTDIMVTGCYYEFKEDNFNYYRSGASVVAIAPKYLANVHDDGMLYKMIKTDNYVEGAYKNAQTFDKVYSQTFEEFMLISIYVDEKDPSYFEFYIEMPDGTKAVIMPFST